MFSIRLVLSRFRNFTIFCYHWNQESSPFYAKQAKNVNTNDDLLTLVKKGFLKWEYQMISKFDTRSLLSNFLIGKILKKINFPVR